jgi:DNA-binding transcriptional LysR family regulator
MAAFVRAVETGSFAAAADVLGLSAPMVGKHIRYLEERMGVRLINRTTRRQLLTEVGQAYYDQCRMILADVDAAETMATEQLSAPRGRLRVTMPTVLGRICIAPLLLAMATDFPDLKLEMSFTDDMVDLADYDLAIRSLAESSGGVPGGASMMTRRLSAHQMLVCASPGYLSRHAAPVSHEDVADHEAILFGKHGRRQQWRFPAAAGPPIVIEPPPRVVMDDLAAIADAAASGAGLAWLPSWLIRRYVERGELVVLALGGPSFTYNNNALWHQSARTPKIRTTVDHLVAGLPQLM